MKRIAIFPGSFDPFTIGHENIVLRAVDLFDRIIIGIGYNHSKRGYFPLEKRMEWINYLFDQEPKVTVERYEGLTVDFAQNVRAGYILRGIRTAADFEFERAIAQVNKAMTGIDSVFLLTTPEHTPVNSSIVRDIMRHGGDPGKFIPVKIREKIANYRLNHK